MKINKNPSYDLSVMKSQLSEKVFQVHFDNFQTKGFVWCCLRFYDVHFKFFFNTQLEYCKYDPKLKNAYGRDFLIRLDTVTEGIFKNLPKNSFTIKDLKFLSIPIKQLFLNQTKL